MLGVITRGNEETLKYLKNNHLKRIEENQKINQRSICILTVPDKHIADMAKKIQLAEGSIIVHCAGSVNINVFESLPYNIGVFYPVQTFNKTRITVFKNVPVCLEADNEATLSIIKNLAEKITNRIYILNSQQRLALHIAAVFACNFTNLMYTIADKITTENNIDFLLLQSLIQETAQRTKHHKPSQVQTGPAVRNDTETMQAHISQLPEKYKKLYKTLSDIICKTQ